MDRDCRLQHASCPSAPERSLARQLDHLTCCCRCSSRKLRHNAQRSLSPVTRTRVQPRPPPRRPARPATKRAPAMPHLVAAAGPRSNPLTHPPARQPFDRPEPERQRDGGGSVQQPAQHPPRRRDHHRPAAPAPVAPQLQPELLWLLARAHRAQQRPLPGPMANQAERLTRGGSRPPAGRALCRTHRPHPRRILCPKFDVQLEVDDALGAPLLLDGCRSTTGTFSTRAPSPILCGRLPCRCSASAAGPATRCHPIQARNLRWTSTAWLPQAHQAA